MVLDYVVQVFKSYGVNHILLSEGPENRADANIIDAAAGDSCVSLLGGMSRKTDNHFVSHQAAGDFSRQVFLTQMEAIGFHCQCDIRIVIHNEAGSISFAELPNLEAFPIFL